TAGPILARPARGQHSGKWQVPATSPAVCAAGERTAIYVPISFLATPAMASVSLRHQLVAPHLAASMWDAGAVVPVCEVLHTSQGRNDAAVRRGSGDLR